MSDDKKPFIFKKFEITSDQAEKIVEIAEKEGADLSINDLMHIGLTANHLQECLNSKCFKQEKIDAEFQTIAKTLIARSGGQPIQPILSYMHDLLTSENGLFKEIENRRAKKALPPLSLGEKWTLAEGLWYISQSQSIDDADSVAYYLDYVDITCGDPPEVTCSPLRLKKARLAFSDAEMAPFKTNETFKCQLSKVEGKYKPAVITGTSVVVAPVAVYDLDLVVTATLLALQRPWFTGFNVCFAVKIEEVVRAFFNINPKTEITEKSDAWRLVTDSLERSMKNRLEALDISDAVIKGRIADFPVAGSEAFFPAEKGYVYEPTPDGSKKAFQSYIMYKVPFVYRIADGRCRIRCPSRELRPQGIGYLPETEVMYTRVLARLGMIADKPISGIMKVSDLITQDDRHRLAYARTRLTTILDHFEALGLCDIKRTFSPRWKTLTEFELTLPKKRLDGTKFEDKVQASEFVKSVFYKDSKTVGDLLQEIRTRVLEKTDAYKKAHKRAIKSRKKPAVLVGGEASR